MVDPLDPDLALAFHWVVKIVSVIVCAIVFGVIGLVAGGVGVGLLAKAIFTGTSRPELLILLLDVAVWLFVILGAVLGGYVGHWLIPNKDK